MHKWTYVTSYAFGLLPNIAIYTHQQGPTNICCQITTQLITHRCTVIYYFNKVYNNLNWGPVPHFAPWKHCSQCGLLYILVTFLNVPALNARCLPRPQPAVVLQAAKGGTMGEKCWPNGVWDMHPGFFYMRHGTDNFTSLAEDFYRPLKIQRLRPGLNPRTWVSEASTLPLHHRSRCLSHLLSFH